MHLICPPKILDKHSFQFLLGRLQYPGEMKNKGYAKVLGANKVHYGRCASGELMIFLLLFTSLLAWRTLKFLIYYLSTKKPILKLMKALPCLSLIFSRHIFYCSTPPLSATRYWNLLGSLFISKFPKEVPLWSFPCSTCFNLWAIGEVFQRIL